VADFLFDIKPEEDLVLYGNKEKRWSWVHLDDLGDAYVKLAQNKNSLGGEIFNIADLDNPTYQEIRTAIAKVVGWKGNVVSSPIPEKSGMINWEATVKINPQKAFQLLNWKPKHCGFLREIDIYYNSWKVAKATSHH